MKAPAGAVVRIYVDLVERVLVGDVIETQTGRRYHVIGVREQQRGKHRGRQHLTCNVLATDADLRYLPAVECDRAAPDRRGIDDGDLICSAVGHDPDDLCDRYRVHGSHDARVHRIRWYPRRRRSA